MIVVIPMAGRGSRFLEAADQNPEYLNPKPLISILGKPMVKWALDSLSSLQVPSSKLIFICRRDHEEEFNISTELKKIFAEDINVLFVDQITRGAAETVLIAKEFINTDEDIIVSDSDHYFDGTPLYEAIKNRNPETAGIIPVFEPPDNEPKWSYTLFDENNVASAVGEKDAALAAQGAYANIGGYYFSKGSVFVAEAEEMIEKGEMYGAEGKKEFYMAPVYDRLIKKGHRVEVAIIPQVWGLGTPKDLEYFEKNFS
ncbi:MAG: hypothetical protein A2700_00565 [Candidatus Blackburnbacteria bacterium RIFCSPHIGHO2_01_FULL_44_64]|uniref:Nucleotidyl transferase domain-containing protein n=1 Tax=Candidatus Blackburnbacteria bacterium RIFCSPHIGHO2_02_FULL_44_20 TaxID=1797516 RepID=A0A1G1V989_9BACT|nr:MAG: hypothetical protein A2700_00565 [Candidatus Blackburnbacteria bacterium RIFCSPHIGHO2_01_FULL_44_64]OGY10166.1 MAG: hypothetical protein A3E16_02880 [Candidatus Blackburnbacteria bacterium RIFCSPHIGHO2_12_FULL_44_25]OGY12014.1 MAG: hypothetical protein A3D26_00630 [Candidatus Blackburnbacteria bacterium RIFCSPHIGHO2_02_FULL_44_20]OGY14538.1 MAG: hypothetical protein A3A62_03405 [Candidatus Blackburnbacteria bacterium RIFCSPLOWO2_01_FULL_44_43]OGY17455.1 MAG: hypothetical protein A3H88_0